MGKDLKGRELGKGISQRKSGKYQARYQDRFGNRKTVYADTVPEIKKTLAEAVRLDLCHTNVRKKILLCDWYPEWMQTYKEPIIRPNTKRHYEQVFKKHILPALGEMYVNDVRPVDVQRLVNDLDARGYQWETQSKVKVLLNDLFTVAIENEYATKNPAKSIKLTKEKPNERIVLSSEDEEAFLTCCAGTFYDHLYVVALNTGLRPGEICALTESDIDFDENTISVAKTLIYQKLDDDTKKEFHLGPPKTDSSERTVPMTAAAKKALKEQIVLKTLLARRHPMSGEFADLLFVTSHNTPICSQTLSDSIKRITDEINLQRDATERIPEFSGHTFRHTFATRWIESGGTPKALQKILGHATLQMTMDLYVHVTHEFEQSEMERVEATMPTANIPSIEKERPFKVI